MKQLLAPLLLFFGLTALLQAAPEIRTEHFRAVFDGVGVDVIADASNRKLYRVSGLSFGKALQTGKGEWTTNADGSADIRYPLGNSGGDYVRFRLTLKDARLDVAIEAKTDAKLGTQQLLRRSYGQNRTGVPYHSGIWFRPANGGLPYEKRGVALRVFPVGEFAAYEQISGNSVWSDSGHQHINLTRNPETGVAHGAFSCLFLPAGSETLAAALLNREPLKIAIPALQPFQLWQSGVEKPAVTAIFANPAATARQVRYRVTVRDYDGTPVLDRAGAVELAPCAQFTLRIEPTLQGERGIWFVEVVADSGEFARTMIGVLPEHRFADPKAGIFGIAATFDVPSRDDVVKLLRRMGVGWVREMGTTSIAARIGANSFYHSNRAINALPGESNRAKREDYIAAQLERIGGLRAVGWEFPNEWNMKALNTGTGADVLTNDYYREIRRQIAAKHPAVRLYGPALAGGDLAFLRKLVALNIYQELDAITIHPGRGNMTADYAGNDYWNYYGTLLRVRKFMATQPAKPLFLTEVYACTTPNSWWHDSYRQAADNIVLLYALALKEQVKAAFFYQLHDGVWFNVGSLKPENPEYYYGLLHRDGTLKPSLLAYCHIAETLENARFVRDLQFPQKSLRGMLLERKGTPFAILWNREEGYFQSRKSPDFKHSEPWVPAWRKGAALRLPAAGDAVEVRDTIGRPSRIPAANGEVTLTLTGSPIVVYGLNSTILQ